MARVDGRWCRRQWLTMYRLREWWKEWPLINKFLQKLFYAKTIPVKKKLKGLDISALSGSTSEASS